jgi:hypothetical protein
MDLVRDAKCVYAASIKLFYIIIPQKKWNPSLRTPLKFGHLSNKDIFSYFLSLRTIQFFSPKNECARQL